MTLYFFSLLEELQGDRIKFIFQDYKYYSIDVKELETSI